MEAYDSRHRSGHRGALSCVDMETSPARSTLASLLAEQQLLEEQVHDLRLCAEDTLRVGSALLAFASREDEAFRGVAPILDPVVQQDLAAEHQRFADDLQLLQWLVQTTPDSPDILVLTVSLRRRMRQHIDRDGRLLIRAVGLSK